MKISFTVIKTFLILQILGGRAHQRFREEPMSVLVAEGDIVELRCAVDEQQGKVQWAKDGFALGFERPVPGYPRYHYHGEPSLGEHHLIITGVALQDDGEYQCQVGPTEDEEPIWAAANVTVLVAPTSISIVGWADGDTVGVESDTALALECLVQDARPAPKVTWYKNGVLVDSNLQEDSVEEGSEPRLQSVRSHFLLTVNAEADGEQISCRGHHPALSEALTALVASITISVLHPPKPPVIVGYTKGTPYMAGDVISLTCKSEGGVPRPSVEWYRQGILTDESWKDEDEFVVNNFEISLTPEDDGIILTCRVSNGVNEEPLENAVGLSVLYSPEKVTIEAPSYVSIGQRLKLICRSAPSNPESQIRWKIEGVNFNVNSTKVQKFPESGWITSSTIHDYLVAESTSRDGSHVTVKCDAISPITSHLVSSEVVIDIVRPPEPPLLDGVSNEVERGTKISISCYSRGGNPPPTMQLFKSDQMLESDLRSHENVSEIFSEIRVDETDNGKIILCRLLHPAHPNPLDTTQRLDVHFAPTSIKVETSSSSMRAGDTISFICETSACNPPAKVTWYSRGEHLQATAVHRSENGGQITRSEFSLKVTAKDDGRTFSCEASNGLEPPIYGNITLSVIHSPIWIVSPESRITVTEGQNLTIHAEASANPLPIEYEWRRNNLILPITSDTVTYPSVSREEGGRYSVFATNPTGNTSISFTLDIQYPPEVSIEATNLTLKLNEEGMIICSAEGNPIPKLRLFSLYSNQTTASGIASVVFKIKKAKIEDARTILCIASNGIGNAVQKRAKVFIEHGALILRQSGLKYSVHGSRAYILCHARGFPEPFFQWSSSSGVISPSDLLSFQIQETRLVDEVSLWLSVMNVSDYRTYQREIFKCSVMNPSGEDFREIRLSPPDRYLSLGELKIINIKDSSVSFSWSFAGQIGEVSIFVLVVFNLQDPSYKITRIVNDTTVTVDNLLPESLNLATLYAAKENGFLMEVVDSVVVSFDGDNGFTNLNSHKSTLAIGGIKVPRLVLLITTLTGISLLVLNIAVITCYLRAKRDSKRETCMKCFGTESLDASEVKSLSSDVYFPAKRETRIQRVNSLNSLDSSTEKINEPTFHQRRLSLSEMSSTSSISQRHSLKGSLRMNESPILQGRKLHTTPEHKHFRLSINSSPFSFQSRNILEEKAIINTDNNSDPPNTSPSHQMIQPPFTSTSVYSTNSFPESFSESNQIPQACVRSQNANYPSIFPKAHVVQSDEASQNPSSLSPYTKMRESLSLPYQQPHHRQEMFHQHHQHQQRHYEEQHDVKPKYATLNLASLCEIGSSNCDRRCYNRRVCAECSCKCPYAKNIEGFTTPNPNQRRNVSLYTSSLPRYFKASFTPHNTYNPEYYCEDCCCQSNGIKPAYSSLDLCHVNNMKWQRSQYPYRNPYFRSHSLDHPYSYQHKEIPTQERIEEYEMNSSPFEEVDSGSGEQPPSNIMRNSINYNENITSEHLVDSESEKHQVEMTQMIKQSPTSLQSRTKSHPRVTFVLSENSDGDSRKDSPSPSLKGIEPTEVCKWKVNGKAKAFSDGEEDTTISSSESTSSIVEQKFQAYFRNNSLTRGEKRFKRVKN